LSCHSLGTISPFASVRACPGEFKFLKLISEDDGQSVPLFADGKPTQITDEALRFCIAFQNDHGVTKNFVQALAEQNLLVEVQYAASMTVGKYISLKAFRMRAASRTFLIP
jgi:SapC